MRTRGKQAGEAFCDAIIELLHLMYNKKTATRILRALINRLRRAEKEFK